jgi:hypothetical protein
MTVIVINPPVALPSHRNDRVNKSRVVDNRGRPAQPEPDEDPATQIPPVREGQKRPDGTVERTAPARGPKSRQR